MFLSWMDVRMGVFRERMHAWNGYVRTYYIHKSHFDLFLDLASRAEKDTPYSYIFIFVLFILLRIFGEVTLLFRYLWGEVVSV